MKHLGISFVLLSMVNVAIKKITGESRINSRESRIEFCRRCF
jgi:hypothetical protein